MLTPIQKKVLLTLRDGGYILKTFSRRGSINYTVYIKNAEPVLRIRPSTFDGINWSNYQRLLKMDSKKRYKLSKKGVRGLRKNTWVYKNCIKKTSEKSVKNQ